MFSQIRNKGISHPRASKFRTALKLVCLSQLLYTRQDSCYKEDDTPHQPDFINQTSSGPSEESEMLNLDPVIIDETLTFLNSDCKKAVSSVAKRTLSVREVWGSISGSVKSTQCRQRLATVATILRSCVAQALSRRDGPRNSLHALA